MIPPGRPRSLSREGRGHRGHERLRRWKQDHWYVTQSSHPNLQLRTLTNLPPDSGKGHEITEDKTAK
jgi:hypothetical protein